MFRWLSMLLRDKLDAYYRRINEQSQRVSAKSKAHHSRPTRKLHLESLEDRIVPSLMASPPPPAVPPVAAIVSQPEIAVVTAAKTLYNDAIKTVETTISAYQHLDDKMRATLEAALNHHHPITRFLPPAPPPATNYLWSPTNGDDASHPENWKKNSVQQDASGSLPGDGPNDIVQFDSNTSNTDITWDTNPHNTQGWQFIEMILGPNGGAYTGEQTINSGIKVELLGTTALAMPVTSSNLRLWFTNSNSVFQIDGNATITNMELGSTDGIGQFVIHAGTTKIGVSSSPANHDWIGVPFRIDPTGTLNDQSNNALQFWNSNIILNVQGTMDVFYGPGNGATLISGTGYTGDYISVNGGTFYYGGKGNVTDTFNVPVLVSNSGNFQVTSAKNQAAGAKLIVQDGSNFVCPNGSDESVYMTGAGSAVQLSQKATLECDSDYYQNQGTLETTNANDPCYLQDFSFGALSTVNIAGGYVSIAPSTGGYSSLNVMCKTLNFNGMLDVAIAGNTSGTSDVLNVNNSGSPINLQGNSGVTVFVNGTLADGTWPIISSSKITGDFWLEFSNPGGLDFTPNQPAPGGYEVSYTS